MKLKYHGAGLMIVMFDGNNQIIHQNKWNIDIQGAMPDYTNGTRIELDDNGVKYIGTVSDVKKWIQADSSGNMTESVHVTCSGAYKV